MKIGFSTSGNGTVDVNMLTGAETEEEFAKSLEEGEKVVAFLDTDSESFKNRNRGDLAEPFDAIHALVSVNHFHTGSICYALEELLEQVFMAGWRYSAIVKFDPAGQICLPKGDGTPDYLGGDPEPYSPGPYRCP